MVALALKTIIADCRPNTSHVRAFAWYDYIIVSFSGGKDSLALVLALIEAGVPREKIILWHQHIDGEPGLETPFMDWPCTEAYCRQVAKALGVRIFFQWRIGGFEKEMLKDNDKSQPVRFELMDGTIGQAGGIKGKISTRRLFPQPTADLSVRWCSAALKIDVAASAICNEPAFKTAKILFLTGERRQESAARSKYAEVEEHRTHSKARHVDHYRMVIDWTEQQVWEIIERHKILPHPAYRLGWGRVSCLACIFGQQDQWASVRLIAPALFAKIAQYERDFGKTIHRSKSVEQLADEGTPYPACQDQELVRLAMSKDYNENVVTDNWTLPSGAYKHCGGPT
jgi:3'-phosphoadenosine 5'-phosphosulfate sulfotransferase (PAPS reductase)/FAD synthetase